MCGFCRAGWALFELILSLGDCFDYARHQLDVALVDSEMTAIEFLVAVFDFETLQSLSQDPQS